MSSTARIGLMYCLVFVSLEAFQAVYLGAVFQKVDSFLVGAWVFGISVVGCTVMTAIFRPDELAVSLRAWRIVLALNLFAAVTWCTYFLAVQLIEPAIVFTIFSGMVPMGTVLAKLIGLPEASSFRRKSVDLGNILIFLAILFLAAITVLGFSGFVRGGWLMAVAGVVLSALSGTCTAFVILFSVRLNGHGVGPLAQFGFRFLLYTCLALIAFAAGLDDKGDHTVAADLALVVLIGLAVIAFPLYLVQRAIPLLHASVIAAMTALGPVMVFLMQLMERRVDYSGATLVGVSIYMAGALLAVFGATQPVAGSISPGKDSQSNCH
ncbi:drug/metabolite transporter (DMT)-like permease [Labrenzia sp. EL_142]|nr:drug/metabolite transporter (DMT)-like permease [Labrenzia sp. EL_142]